MDSIFWKIEENERTKRYILKNGAKLLYAWAPLVWMLIFGPPVYLGYSSRFFSLVFGVSFLLLWLSLAVLHLQYLPDWLRNSWNGKKITFGGGYKSFVTRKTFFIEFEK